MKKFTLLCRIAILGGLFAFSTKLSAQITITSADLPHAGLVVTTDSMGSPGLSPGSAGANISWDFSTLTNQKAHTINFMDASATPYSSVAAFSAANLADSTVGGNGYNFFDTSASSFAVVGAEEIESAEGYSFQIEAGLSPLFVQANLPATYSSVVAPSVSYGTETLNESIESGLVSKERFSTTITYSDTVDAWGTMKMPSGNTYKVLRQIHHEYDVDSVFVYITLTSDWELAETLATYKNQYDWYTNGAGYILAEMDMGTTFDTAAHDVIWDESAPTPTGINNISVKNAVNAYPSPANTQITFSAISNANQFISIFDITGRQIERTAMQNGLISVNTSAYSSGVYLYTLTDNSGNMLDQGKFVVQH